MKKTVRSSVSIPAELKARMDAIEEPVNWSTVAVQAFEAKLAEIITRRGVKDMRDTIARLRESRRKGGDELVQQGHRDGRQWAASAAEADELERLSEALESSASDGRDLFDDNTSTAYGADERFVFTIRPDSDGDRQVSLDFWGSIVGYGINRPSNKPEYVQAFAEGAAEVWDEVKDKL